MIGAVKVISGTAHPELAHDICKNLGTDLCRTTVVRFSNENMLVQIDENVREADVFVIQPSHRRSAAIYVGYRCWTSAEWSHA